MNIQDLSNSLGLIIQLATIVTLIYTLYKFSRKPHDSLEERHNDLEKRVDKHDLKFEDHFREQDATNEVLIHSTLALIEFEIQYCLTEHKDMSKGLEKAKDDLNNYLARK